MLTINPPFRLIQINMNRIYDDDLLQLMQFTIRRTNSININQIVGVIDILYDTNNNNIYIIHNDKLYKPNRNNCTVNLIIYKLYPGKQVDISIDFASSHRNESVNLNMCTDMINDNKYIPDFIIALQGGICQGDIQLH